MSPAERTYGFGIIGTGVVAHIHAMAIAAIPQARLKAVFNVGKEKADAFAVRHGCTSYGTIGDLTSDPGIDIVCICTPSGAHLEAALACIRAGKHCLIEKPLEVTPERCDAIIEAAEKAGVKLGVIFNSRFHDAAMQLRRSVEEGRFGEMVFGDAYVKWHRTPAYYASSAWRGTWALDGGGALMNQGIHSVDLLQWFMGPVKSVKAFAANRLHRNIQAEDTVSAVLEFANGALGNIAASTAVYPGALKQIEISGTEGTAILRENRLIEWSFLHKKESDAMILQASSELSVSHGGVSDPADISYLGHQRQIEDIIRSVRTGVSPFVDGVEGRKSVAIVCAVYESARTGRMVFV